MPRERRLVVIVDGIELPFHHGNTEDIVMLDKQKPYDMITDFVTGEKIPNIGAEEKRQQVEQFLVENKGYQKQDIEVDASLRLKIGTETYDSAVDLVLRLKGKRFMVIKCVPGSLGSRHRETLAAARLLDTYQIPFTVVTDGKNADLLDTLTGEIIDQGLHAIASRTEALDGLAGLAFEPFAEAKMEREKIIFRSYDQMNVNVQRKLQSS